MGGNRPYRGGAQAFTTRSAAKGLAEAGAANSNIAVGNALAGGFTKLAAASRFLLNQGCNGERRGSATLLSGTTSVVVTHGVDGNPSIDEVRVTPRTGLGAATQFWVSNMTATQFTINVNVNPGTNIQFNWGIAPVYQ